MLNTKLIRTTNMRKTKKTQTVFRCGYFWWANNFHTPGESFYAAYGLPTLITPQKGGLPRHPKYPNTLNTLHTLNTLNTLIPENPKYRNTLNT